MTYRILALAVAGVCFTATLAAAQPGAKPAAQTVSAKVAASCQKCHGMTGESPSPIYPRLNGQHVEYVEAQLKAFRGHRRDDTRARGYMWVESHDLDDKMVTSLASYFASQKPTSPQTGGVLAAEGEKLFMNGDAAKGIAACQQCHGKSGEGNGAIPRIAGQHAYYFRMVMGGFRSGLRQNQMMQAVTKNMTDLQIDQLSSYLANE
jgi:cytochrome c553